jgi:16S rRNA (guanine527-N7)-methyltransferase
MDEAGARQWLKDELVVSRETFERLDSFVAFLRDENERQNLVSRGTLDSIWARHIVDSAQLIRFAPNAPTWLDLGTGAGFPGLIIAALHPARVTMVEERRMRVDFLHRASELLGIEDKSVVIPSKVERFEAGPFDAISARAFAPLAKLLDLGARFATPETRWVLPKGRNAKSELEAVESSWQGVFQLEPSLTDADAQIIVAEQVRRRGKGTRKP